MIGVVKEQEQLLQHNRRAGSLRRGSLLLHSTALVATKPASATTLPSNTAGRPLLALYGRGIVRIRQPVHPPSTQPSGDRDDQQIHASSPIHVRGPAPKGRRRRVAGREPSHRERHRRSPCIAGRATGPVRIVQGPQDFGGFRDGDVLVAKATAPAWTPLFARAAGVVTDGGSLAAHASLVAANTESPPSSPPATPPDACIPGSW